MKLPIVDENDVKIGVKERDELGDGDFYRVSALWVTNSQGDILLAQRALSKKNSPGKWGPAVAGTVEEGETYESNIVKEIQEELGISVSLDQLTKGPKVFVKTTAKGFFDQWFFYTTDLKEEDFTIPADEVAQLKWVSRLEFQKWYSEKPEDFLSNTAQWLPYVFI